MTSKKAFYIHLEKVYVSLLTELLTEIKNTNLKSIESVFYCEKFFFAYFLFFSIHHQRLVFIFRKVFISFATILSLFFSSLERY